MKKIIISSSICLVIGCIIGAGSLYLFYNKKNQNIKNDIVVTTIDGPENNITIEKVKNNKENLELTISSKENGKAKTTIKKSSFCPKLPKNEISAIVYAGINQMQPSLSYGIEYRRNVFKHVHVLTGLKIDTNVYMVNGFQIFVGAGINL